DASNVSLTDAVPAGTTFVSEMQTAGPSFTFTNPAPGGTGTISGSITTLPALTSATFQIVVFASPADVNGSSISNTANVSTSSPDTNSGNDSSTTTATVVTSSDLSVSKTGPATVTAGAATNVTYT